MPDIFDEIAEQDQRGGGDIFDRVTERTASAAPTGDIFDRLTASAPKKLPRSQSEADFGRALTPGAARSAHPSRNLNAEPRFDLGEPPVTKRSRAMAEESERTHGAPLVVAPVRPYAFTPPEVHVEPVPAPPQPEPATISSFEPSIWNQVMRLPTGPTQNVEEALGEARKLGSAVVSPLFKSAVPGLGNYVEHTVKENPEAGQFVSDVLERTTGIKAPPEVAEGVMVGAARQAEGLATPFNLALLGYGIPGLSSAEESLALERALGSAANAARLAQLERQALMKGLVDTYFTVSMGSQVPRGLRSSYEAYKSGDLREATAKAAEAVITGAFAYGAGQGAYRAGEAVNPIRATREMIAADRAAQPQQSGAVQPAVPVLQSPEEIADQIRETENVPRDFPAQLPMFLRAGKSAPQGAQETGGAPYPRALNQTTQEGPSAPQELTSQTEIPTEPVPVTEGDENRIAGVEGRDTTLLTPTSEIPARYRVVEANSLTPSHNAFTFAKNPEYPEGVQERAYHTSKEAQARVVNQAQNYQPEFTVNTNPDAVNGPPIVTPDGIVLGGNSRTMSTQRIYSMGQGADYRDYLVNNAQAFGLRPEDVAGMKNPVLVREIPAPESLDEARRVGSELNKSLTGALGVSERAVSAGKSISLETLHQITAMRDDLGENATLRDLMRERGRDLIPMLVRDRVITDRERPQFIDTATGGLSEEGKNFVERALLGSVVDDPVLMDRTPKSALNKIEGSLADLSSLAGREDEYNILPVLRQALAEHAEIAHRGTSTDLYLRQSNMFGESRNEAVDALVRLLDEKPKAVKSAIRQFAQDARFDVPGQETLGLMEGPSAAQAFNDAFHTNLTDHEILDAVKSAAATELPYESRTRKQTRGVAASPEGLQREPAEVTRTAGEPRIAEDRSREATVTERLVAEEAGFADPGAVGRPVRHLADLITSEAQKVRESRALHEGLYDLESQNQADQVRALQWLKRAPGTAEDWEAVYHHQENPRESLTEQQQKLLDLIAPLNRESQRIYTKLTGGGMPIENYVHREVREKGGFLDRVMQTLGVSGRKAGNVLSKSAAATKGRTMFALTDAAGNREVVAIKGGRVTSFRGGENIRAIDLGSFRHGLTSEKGLVDQKIAPIEKRIRELEKERNLLKATPSRTKVTFERRKNISIEIDKLERQRDAIVDSVQPENLRNSVWVDKSGHKWRIGQATTREIESNTSLRYYHNALASSISNYVETRRAERAYDFLESFKNDPHFAEVAMPRGQGMPPRGWRPVQLDQFRDYYFRPHEAEVLDWFATRMRRDPVGIFEKIGNFLRTSIFFNPLLHVPNIAVHWTVEKGIRGWLPDRFGTNMRSSLRAIDAVIHQNKDFLDALDAGAPLQSQRFETREFTRLLYEKMARELETNPTTAQQVAKALGYANPAKLIDAVYKFSGNATWVSNDIAFMQAVYEKTARGMSLKDAIAETGKHIPTYRLPTRIFDSPTIAKLMSNPSLSMFGAYHYGALRSYGEMLKSVLSPRSSLAERAHGLDLLAWTGLATFVIYPQVDKLLKAVTGNKDAEPHRAGAATFPYNMYLLAKGEKSPTEVAESVVTPAVQAKAAVEFAANRDLRTGRRIYDLHADRHTLAWQLSHRAAEYIAPLGSAERATAGATERKKTALGFLGIRFAKHGAEKIARDILYSKLGQEAPTPESQAHSNLMRDLRDAAEQGNLKPAHDALRSRQIKPKQFEALARTSRGQGLVDLARDFNYDELRKVYDAATPEQKRLLEPELRREATKARVKARSTPTRSVPFFLRPFTRGSSASANR